MAKTISQDLFNVWSRKGGKRARIQVRYKRRFFNGSVFVIESEFTELNERDFSSVGEIASQLDTPFLNVFKQSDITIVLNNTRNEWVPALSSPSVFAADAVAPNGYFPDRMVFQVRFGYVLPDGSTEYLDLFTGIATDYVFEGKSAGVEVVVSSNAELLVSSDASKVSDAFTNEPTIPAVGDTVNKVFLTTSLGVGRLPTFRTGAVTLIQGIDYEVSDLDRPGLPATITTTVAPAAVAIDASGIKWKADIKIEDIVDLLAVNAGITDKQIDPVVMPVGVPISFIVDTEPEWEAGTASLTNIDSNSESGSIKSQWLLIDDFSNVDFQDRWDGSTTGWSVTGGKFRGVATGFIEKAFTGSQGTWSINMFPTSGTAEFTIMRKGGIFLVETTNKYIFKVTGGVSTLFKRTNLGTETSLISLVRTPAVSDVYRITRNSSGQFRVYLNGVEFGTSPATDTDFQSGVESLQLRSVGGTADFDDIFFSGETLTPATAVSNATRIYRSDQFDVGAAPTAWGKLVSVQSLNSGTILIETEVASISGGPFDAFIAISGNGQINSDLKQFIRFRITITPEVFSFNNPQIDKVTINGITTTILISLAVLSGRDGYAQIERYAKLVDYEMGFDGSGKFFFRQKPTTEVAVISINQENAISDLKDFRPGYAKVINNGQVQYGTDFSEFDGAAAGEASPTSEERFGRRILFEDFSDILVSKNADIATAHAQLIYERGRLPRRTCRIPSKIIPWLEQSDIINVTYFDDPLLAGVVWTDPLFLWGKRGAFSVAGNVLANNLDFKITGTVFRPDDVNMDIIVQERLS